MKIYNEDLKAKEKKKDINVLEAHNSYVQPNTIIHYIRGIQDLTKTTRALK